MTWVNFADTDRAVTWDAPTLAIIGHGYEGNAGSYPNADWDNTAASPGAAITTYADDYSARKYVDPEPTWGAWGSEETLPGAAGLSPGMFSLLEGG